MVDLTVDLPADLAAALSFPDSGDGWWRPLVLAAVVLALLLHWAWYRRRHRLRPRDRRLAPPPAPADRLDDPSDPVAAIEARHLLAGTYRQGCHALADLLRERAAWSLRGEIDDVSALTGRELGRRARNRAAAELMSTLGDQRFARGEPTKRDFRTACTLTRDVLGVKR